MKLTRSKKIILVAILTAFVVLLFNSNTVFAEINGDYMTYDPVTDAGLEEAFSESSLLNLLAKLVYAVGQFLEWILGVIFKLLTGTSDFPWADKIVFNAVPLLDVNFINPGGIVNGSDITNQTFVGQPGIQSVLKDLYATIMTLAVAFFGIVVLITAIRLVISTIASEKAKYKQAIVDWLVGFVMLFCIHYAISFIFYLNEELVKVASKMVTAQLEQKAADAQVSASANASQLIESIGNTVYSGKYKGKSGVKIKDILNENRDILEVYINLSAEDGSKGIQEFLMKKHGSFIISWDSAINKSEQKQRLAMIIAWAAEENVSVKQLSEIREQRIYVAKYSGYHGYLQAVMDKDIRTIFGAHYGEIEDPHTGTGEGRNYLKNISGLIESTTSTAATRALVSQNELLWFSGGADEISSIGKLSTNSVNQFQWHVLIKDLIALKGASTTSTGKEVAGSNKGLTLISDLASYFKQNASEKTFRNENIAGLKDSGNINIQNMIMYTILVAQSLILFIAYVKRLFYVILLAMMGPIVVVFDFFQKFGK